MDIKRERRKIYLRCFGLLLALWLALLAAFTCYLLNNALEKERQRFIGSAQSIRTEMDSDWSSVGYSDPWPFAMWQRTLNNWPANDVAMALFTYEGELVWSQKPANIWEVTLWNGPSASEATAELEVGRWFDIDALFQELKKLGFPESKRLTFENIFLTEDGKAIPEKMILQSADGPVVFTNALFSQNQGKLYESGATGDGINVWESVLNIMNKRGSSALHALASDPKSLLPESELYLNQNITNYSIDGKTKFSSRPCGLFDRIFITQVGWGHIVSSTRRSSPDSLPFSYPHPAYWQVFAGQSQVLSAFWSLYGPYWLACIFISLVGFLSAAWLLAHTAWRGQKTHMLYERRARESATAIAHSIKTPLAVLHACAENLEADVYPEKRGQYISEIARQTEAMDQALLNLLDLT